MKQRDVVIDPVARQDLTDIFNWVADARGGDAAINYLGRVSAYINGFELGAQRGTLRQDLAPDLRITGFERRLSIAFVVEETAVYFLRVFTAGQNWEAQLMAKDNE